MTTLERLVSMRKASRDQKVALVAARRFKTQDFTITRVFARLTASTVSFYLRVRACRPLHLANSVQRKRCCALGDNAPKALMYNSVVESPRMSRS